MTETFANLADEAYELDRKENMNDYVLDKELSDKRTAVYTNNKLKDTIISYRGTTADWKDIGSDVAVGLGLSQYVDPRFSEAVNIYDKVYAKYPKNKINLTGHSLGGTLAEHVNNERVISGKVVNFNPGRGIGGLVNKGMCLAGNNKRACKNVETFRSKTDIISLLPSHSGKTHNMSTSSNPIKAHKLTELTKTISKRNISKALNKKKQP